MIIVYSAVDTTYLSLSARAKLLCAKIIDHIYISVHVRARAPRIDTWPIWLSFCWNAWTRVTQVLTYDQHHPGDSELRCFNVKDWCRSHAPGSASMLEGSIWNFEISVLVYKVNHWSMLSQFLVDFSITNMKFLVKFLIKTWQSLIKQLANSLMQINSLWMHFSSTHARSSIMRV